MKGQWKYKTSVFEFNLRTSYLYPKSDQQRYGIFECRLLLLFYLTILIRKKTQRYVIDKLAATYRSNTSYSYFIRKLK